MRAGDPLALVVALHELHGSPWPRGVGEVAGDFVATLVLLCLTPRTSQTVYVQQYARIRRLVTLRPGVTDWSALGDIDLDFLPEPKRRALVEVGEWVWRGDLEPSTWDEMAPGEAEATLCRIPGVGRKVARAALAYGLGWDLGIVDRHTHRVTARLLGRVMSLWEVERWVDDLPWGLAVVWHVDTFAHGRAVCGATPGCGACALRDSCPTGLAHHPDLRL